MAPDKQILHKQIQINAIKLIMKHKIGQETTNGSLLQYPPNTA